MTVNADRIRALNDDFRAAGPVSGSWMLTCGVDARGAAFVAEAVRMVREFDGFGPNNDPHREHDFGSFELAGEKVFWKIDYYAPDLAGGSDDPADPSATRRILTLMLASEY